MHKLAAGRAQGVTLPDPTALQWVTVRQPVSTPVLPLGTDLGPDETEVLALALESTDASVKFIRTSLTEIRRCKLGSNPEVGPTATKMTVRQSSSFGSFRIPCLPNRPAEVLTECSRPVFNR